MPDRSNKTQEEKKAELFVKGYCPHHEEFQKSIDEKLNLIEDKSRGMWGLVEAKWHNIVADSQTVILEHIADLKGMVTAFITRNSNDITRLNEEVKKINNRVANIEQQIFTILKNQEG
jgi:hypothetical protein